MTDDWSKFKKLISLDQTVERNKQTKQFKKQKTHVSQQTSYQEQIIPIQSLVRDIFLDDRRTVERSILNRLRRGSHPIDMSIDLHGYTVDEAYNVFYNSFLYAIKNNCRLLLIITGKGNRDGYSIRGQLLKWVNIREISSYIIYISEAHHEHGSEGAFYLVLRSHKS